MSPTFALALILVVLLVAGGPWWGYSSRWGYGPFGIVGVLLVILLVFMLLGRV